MPTGDVMCRFGVVPDNAHFDSSLLRYRKNLMLDDAIDHLEEHQAYIAIYNPENDAGYRPVIEGLLGEIAVATKPFEHCINGYSSYIFISARDSVTPYHMDREMNFLFQIRGRKTVRLWNPNDDVVMSPVERDHLFTVCNDARNWMRGRCASSSNPVWACTTRSSRRIWYLPDPSCRSRWRSPSAPRALTTGAMRTGSTSRCAGWGFRPGGWAGPNGSTRPRRE